MKIRELRLYSPNLEAQTAFYSQVLGLPVMRKTADTVSFKMGESVLTLNQHNAFVPYHYAINIPANQENEALAWLKKRVEILKDGEFEIQHFKFWNAEAIYFYDADQNIVELIARKNLVNNSDKSFGSDALLEISEIGVPTDDIGEIYDTLNERLDLPIYSGSVERFCAIGDERGLFIVINKLLKEHWFPTTDHAYPAEFEVQLVINETEVTVTYQQEKLTILNIY